MKKEFKEFMKARGAWDIWKINHKCKHRKQWFIDTHPVNYIHGAFDSPLNEYWENLEVEWTTYWYNLRNNM